MSWSESALPAGAAVAAPERKDASKAPAVRAAATEDLRMGAPGAEPPGPEALAGRVVAVAEAEDRHLGQVPGPVPGGARRPHGGVGVHGADRADPHARAADRHDVADVQAGTGEAADHGPVAVAD